MMTSGEPNIYLCNVPSAHSIASSLGERCGVLEYQLPLALNGITPGAVLVLRPAPEHLMQDDGVARLDECVQACRQASIFLALSTSPRSRCDSGSIRAVTRSNLLCMERAAQWNLGLVDLDVSLAFGGAENVGESSDELSAKGIIVVTVLLREAVEVFFGMSTKGG
jgi:hypothetical protein